MAVVMAPPTSPGGFAATVVCPLCGAQPGVRCVTNGGNTVPDTVTYKDNGDLERMIGHHAARSHLFYRPVDDYSI